jgi:hypothetical protein
MRSLLLVIDDGQRIKPMGNDSFDVRNGAGIEMYYLCNGSTSVFGGVDSIVFSGIWSSNALK